MRKIDGSDRIKIKELIDNGEDVMAISKILGIHNSTIYREIKRCSNNGEYDPFYYDKNPKQRRKKKSLIESDQILAEFIAKKSFTKD
jgi:IS30 family transposase